MFILVLLIWAVFRGFTRGFIMQLTLLAALAVGVFAALKLSGYATRQLEGLLNVNSESLFLVSVGITFILVFIGISILGRIVEKMVETIQLSIVNRLLGVLFSLVKMIFVAGIILAFVDRIDRKVHLLPENSQEHYFFISP
jgi:membrane protein required for colicin V production